MAALFPRRAPWISRPAMRSQILASTVLTRTTHRPCPVPSLPLCTCTSQIFLLPGKMTKLPPARQVECLTPPKPTSSTATYEYALPACRRRRPWPSDRRWMVSISCCGGGWEACHRGSGTKRVGRRPIRELNGRLPLFPPFHFPVSVSKPPAHETPM
jgi:hypothetical protein